MQHQIKDVALIIACIHYNALTNETWILSSFTVLLVACEDITVRAE